MTPETQTIYGRFINTMHAQLILCVLLAACLIWIICIRKKSKALEAFNVLGGNNDTRLGQIGSTTMTAATIGSWIPVASWTNTVAWQNHALTLEIYPRNRGAGATRQTFAVLVRNNDKAQESDPIFIQQNIFDSLPDKTNTGPTFNTGVIRYAADPKNPLNNLYEMYLQMGTSNCNNVSCSWTLSDFTTNDTVAVANTDQVASVTGGTKLYAPRMIGGDVKASTILTTLQVGDNDKENLIRFKGVAGDGGSDGGNTYNHTVIAERLWGNADQSEMLLFKGADNEACGNGSCGPDRIRLDSTGDVQIQTGGVAGRTYDPANNAGNTVFHARDDGRVSIGMQGSGKTGQKDRQTWGHNPYGDRIGAPTTYIDRLEVGADPLGENKTAAVLRLHSWGSGAAEFYKPPGQTMYLRETPGNTGSFNSFNVQVPMTIPQINSSGNVTVGGTIFTDRICDPAGNRCLNLADADNLNAAAKGAVEQAAAAQAAALKAAQQAAQQAAAQAAAQAEAQRAAAQAAAQAEAQRAAAQRAAEQAAAAQRAAEQAAAQRAAEQAAAQRAAAEAAAQAAAERATTLNGGSTLNAGQQLVSGPCGFVMQGDGNAVIYNNGRAVWATNTVNKGRAPYSFTMQGDGNAVLYAAGTPTWASATNGWGPLPAKLVLGSNGSLTIYASNGGVIKKIA